MRWTRKAALVCAALAVAACENDGAQTDDLDAETAPASDEDAGDMAEHDASVEGASSADASTVPDAAGSTADAASPSMDGGLSDAAPAFDAGSDADVAPDASVMVDASPSIDATNPADSGQPAAQTSDTGQPDVPAPPVCTDQCSGHGTCTLQGSATACTCDVGHTGGTCGSCSSGYGRSAGTGPCLALASVVEVRAVPPDGTCATGGHTLLEGVDSDLSGSLEPGEVTKQQTVCKVVRSGNVIITNAAELESLRGVTEITGSLTIRAPYVTSLEPLKMLIAVGSNLLIEGSNSLTDLSGLSWLDNVGGSMTVRSNAALRSTVGMTALRLVTGSLLVESNPALRQLHVGPLQVVQGDLTITSHAELVSFDGTRLRSVVGALKLLSTPKLETLAALTRLTAIGGALEIKQCHGLTHLRGLAQLNDVGPLLLDDNQKLVDASALTALRSVRGSFTWRNLPALQIGLGQAQLVSVEGHLAFLQLPLLTSLGSFAQLTSIRGGLLVAKTGVQVIAPFSALTTFAPASGAIMLGCALVPNPIDPLLPPIQPTPSPTCQIYNETLVVSENPALRQFGGFPLRMNGQAQSVGGVAFYDDPQLSQLENLPFTTLASSLRLEKLAALRALPWLSTVQRASVVSILATGLDRIELTQLGAFTTTLKVNDNLNATVLSLPVRPSTNMNLEISGNAALGTLSLPTVSKLASLNVSGNGMASFELPELTEVTNQITVARNAALTSFTWPKLSITSGATVDDNDALIAMPALNVSIEQFIMGVIRVSNNGALRTLPAITGGIFMTIEIINNDALVSLSTCMGGEVVLDGNDSLVSLAGLQAQTGNLRLIRNAALANLMTGGTLSISYLELRDNPALTSLAGASLDANKDLSVINNDALTTLDGLAVAPAVAVSSLRLDDNAALNSLAALSNVSSAATLSIQNNPSLPQCAALAFSTRIAGNGPRTITGNNPVATCP